MFSLFKKIGSAFGSKLRALFSRPIDPASYAALEELFYEADLGPKIGSELVATIEKKLKNNPSLSSAELLGAVEEKLLHLLPDMPPSPPMRRPLHVILLVGVNGSGKTTSLAKLAKMHKMVGKKVMVAAGDTFRAAAIEQLETHAKNLAIDIILSKREADPASVAFDAVQAAMKRGTEVLLIDTAGRLQNRREWMDELKKVAKAIDKGCPGAPHEILLTLDATIGQNGLDQAVAFQQTVPLTGLIVTKIDTCAKGGALVAIVQETKLPILWMGTGEATDDLAPFDKKAFVKALLQV